MVKKLLLIADIADQEPTFKITDTQLNIPSITLSRQENAKLLNQLDEARGTICNWYYLPTAEIKNYNVMIHRQNFFDQPVTNNLITHDSIRKLAAGQGDDYKTDCWLHYNYFKNYYKMMAIDLGKQKALDADSKAIQKI